MALGILELGDLFLSWRLYVGLAITALLCWLVLQIVPSEAVGWAICVPLGITGLVLASPGRLRQVSSNLQLWRPAFISQPPNNSFKPKPLRGSA